MLRASEKLVGPFLGYPPCRTALSGGINPKGVR